MIRPSCWRFAAVLLVGLVCGIVGAGLSPAIAVPPDGTMAIGVHVTLVSRWLDPAETEALITPFMVLYALHDGLVKPMPGGINTPSLAESWTVSKDGITYEFVLRKGAKFHNGDPVTAEDVKFSYERYKGSGAGLLREKVKDVQVVAPNRVRFVLKEAWPDFMSFYGTSATGAGWIVPKKYVEKVGDDGFKKSPVGAGPYKFVSFNPGVELVLEAFPEYWRKAPSVKRLVMRSIPDEATRAASVRTGEVDIAYLFTGPTAEQLRRAPGMKVVAPLVYGVYWLDFLDQWDPKSPWHDRRVRLAASLAIDRPALNQAEMLGMGKLTGAFVPEEVGGFLGGIGIRTRVRTMERATFLSSWREKKIKGLLIGATGAAGNAAARLEPFFTKGGIYAYGSLPEIDDLFQRQAKELDRKQREAHLHHIQRIVSDRVLVAPLFQQGFIWGVGPRVEVAAAGLIQGYPYVGPAEDLKLR
ncbi:MAG: hypothetical protein DME16_13720 [Candidatus Rokuibacteriota bacterium]|nr:MAG: hypothetical protein DME16_13720 [Candidatus Rokubacteria bacterium]